MNPGELDTRVRLLRATGTTTGTGHVAPAWTTIATVWAKVKFLRGEEALAAATVYQKAHTKITVRAGGAASSLQPSDRVELVATGEMFEIEGAVPVPGGRPERVELMVWGGFAA